MTLDKHESYNNNRDNSSRSHAMTGSLSEWIDLEYISSTPELTGLLYDLNLLPEQVSKGSEDEHRLYVLTRYFKENK